MGGATSSLDVRILCLSVKKSSKICQKSWFSGNGSYVTRGNVSCNFCHNKCCVHVAREISRVTPPPPPPPFLQPAMKQNVALRVAGKVELSSTFPNVARQVAACDMSIATCDVILLE